MRHPLYKYYDKREYAEKFLDGEMLFRSLSYFRDCEDAVRGDDHEGTYTFMPDGGLQIHNQTQGTRFTLPYAFESTIRANEIFVFCTSRALSPEIAKQFSAVACVEIRKIGILCHRIQAALPPTTTFKARRVEYYSQGDAGDGTLWALPDEIATSKLDKWKSQDEYRFVFSVTGALGFEKVDLRLVRQIQPNLPNPKEHLCRVLRVGSLGDICRLRDL